MISYINLQKSIEYWETKGFQRIESPWMVTRSVIHTTIPSTADLEKEYFVPNKNKGLVASGEQSFLYLYLKDFLPKGTFQTITPCFRNEPFDFIHTKYFMKNELIDTKNVTEKRLEEIVEEAKAFFDSILNKETIITRTSIGLDVEIDGVELGSYGIRQCPYLKWIYATGCAEPRLSYVQNL